MTPKPQTIGDLYARIGRRLARQGVDAKCDFASSMLGSVDCITLYVLVKRPGKTSCRIPFYFFIHDTERSIRTIIRMCKKVSKSPSRR